MEKQLNEKIIDFFSKTITNEEFAKYTRRFVAESIRMVLDTERDNFNQEWIAEGYYWLNEFCEMIDPQLQKPADYGRPPEKVSQPTR